MIFQSSLGNITNIYNCALLQGEHALFELTQITITMKIRILNMTFQIQEGPSREKI